jgi:hypothetical protein
LLTTEQIPHALAPIFDSTVPYLRRITGLEEARKRGLSADEAYALLQFLHYTAEQTGLTPDHNHALKNEVAENPLGVLPGTAFLALYYNAERGLVDHERLSQAVFASARNDSAKPSVRLTALQVCAALKHPEAPAIARDLLATQSDTHLRMSALAVLGALGNQNDIPTLRQYAQSADIRLRTSANAALEGMYQRSQKTSQANENQRTTMEEKT